MKPTRRFLNWPTLTFALGAAILLPLNHKYSRLGPGGMDHVPTLLLGGTWFAFCGVFMLMATRSPALQWMLLLPRTGTHSGEKRVVFTLLGVIAVVVGGVQLVRGLMLHY